MEGFVYVLVNSSLPGLIKIGKTTKDPEIRARELHHTGTPTPFVVAYSIRVSDCDLLEAQLHAELSSKRESTQREFFRIPCQVAVDLLREKAGSFPVDIPVVENPSSDVSDTVKNTFYACLLSDPTSITTRETDRHLLLAKSILDNEAFTAEIRQKFPDALSTDDNVTCEDLYTPDREYIWFYPGRICFGMHKTYRLGFTSLRRYELQATLKQYFLHLGAITEPVCVEYHENTIEFPLDAILEKYTPYLLSKGEKIIVSDEETLKALVAEILRTSSQIADTAEFERERAESIGKARALARKL